MTTREQFSDEEWTTVTAVPALVIVSAGIADGHLMPAMREFKAGAEALTAGIARYPENAILQAFTAETSSSEADEKDDSEGAAEVTEDVRESMVENITAGIALLRARVTVDEYEQIAEILLDCARSVTGRLGTGFMGSGDEKVTPDEQAFVERLASILQVGGSTAA